MRDNTDSESLKENSMQWLESIQDQEKGVRPYLLYAKIGYQYDDNVRYEPLDEDIFSMEPHVMILREFRDRFLLNNFMGKALVEFYYKTSPPLADFIAEHGSLRTVVRIGLLPVVGMSWLVLQTGFMPLIAFMLFSLAVAASAIYYRRKLIKN